MADPLDALRLPSASADPDPAFAAALRARLERALLAPEATMTRTIAEPAAPTAAEPAPALHTLTPMLRVVDARAAVEFYTAAFGAVLTAEPFVDPDGRVAHAEVAIGDSVLMLADENPQLGLLAPVSGGGSGHAIRLGTPDPDAVVAAAVAAGARLDRPVADAPYGRSGIVVDPDGHAWRVHRDAGTAVTVADGRDTITAYLAVVDARASVEFYVGAFGATRRGEPIVMPDGRVGHVEVAIGNSVLMLSDEHPEMGLEAPVTRGGPSQSLHLETADPDATVAAAVALGARLERPVADNPYGRTGVVVDPDGHRWMISRPAPAARPGDVVYASLWAPDAARTLAFYAPLLGWEPRDGRIPDRGLGTFGAATYTGLMCCYLVPDVDAAAGVVRAAGGTAADPVDEPFGRVADCVDDQGVPFALLGGSAPPLPGGPGSLAYVDLQVPDAVRARAFYGTVLGWRFTPGTAEGYWHVLAAGPMIGLSGGHGTARAVPWFRVDDPAATAAAVRESGGTADAPAATPHGPEAVCADDQGAPFVLTP